MGNKEFLGTEVSATFGVDTLQKDLRGYIFNCLEQANMVLPMMYFHLKYLMRKFMQR